MSSPSAARRDRRWIDAALLMIAVAWLLLGVFRPYYVYDEGIPVVGALRVLAGEVPYRDFYANYSPGQFYLTAAVFRLFGPSLMAQRVLAVIVRALLAWAAYALLRRVSPPRAAGGGWVLLLAWLGYITWFGYTAFPALLFSLISLLCTARAIEHGLARTRGVRVWLGLSGAAAGAAFLFRQDFGVYIAVAQMAFFAIRGVADSVAQPRRGVAAVVRRWGELCIPFALGLATLAILPVAYFIARVGLVEWLQRLFVWPYELTSHYRGLPYPRPWSPLARFGSGQYDWTQLVLGLCSTLAFYVPPLVYLATAWSLFRRSWRDAASWESRVWIRLSLFLFGALAFNQVVHRSDLIHLFPTFCVAVILLPSTLEHRTGVRRRSPEVRAWVASCVMLSLLVLPAFGFLYATVPSLRGLAPAVPSVPRARGIALPEDQRAALNFVQRQSAPGEAVFVGNLRHDRVQWNDIMFYFLVQRPIPTRYHHFDPGMTTTARVQQEIVEELIRNDVRHVVLFSGAELPPEPNLSAVPGASLLDEYVRAHYRPVYRAGRYQVLLRNDEPVEPRLSGTRPRTNSRSSGWRQRFGPTTQSLRRDPHGS